MRRNGVVILVENLPVPLDRRVWQEAQALRDSGWRVAVIGPQGAGAMRALADRLDGIDVFRYPQRPAAGLRGYLVEYVPSMAFSLAWLVWARLRGRIDVIHGCNPPDLFWLHGIVGRLWGSKYVFDQHDANPELSLTKFGSHGLKARLLHTLTRWLEQRSYETASLVIAPNESYLEIARERGRVEGDRVVLVRNAPDVAEYRALAQGVARRPHAVGYVGVMGSQDGLDLLLDAWAMVVRSPGMTDATLHLVGDGEARPDLQRQVTSLGLDGSVRFHGYMRPSEFVPILAACALCVSPDPPTPFNNVSTMVKVVDYLAVGRPIVAFDLHETRVVGGEAVSVVAHPTARALATRITDLLNAPTAAARLEDAARIRVDALNLDWGESARRLVEAYRELATRS